METFDTNADNVHHDNVREDLSDLSGSAKALVMAPQTDADACQAKAPTGGHMTERFESMQGPTIEQLNQAGLAMAHSTVMDDPASRSTSDPYFGLQVLASAAMIVDPSRERGAELRFFRGLQLASSGC